MRVLLHCQSQGLSPCPLPCKDVLSPATVPIISHPPIANDQTPAGCCVIIIMTERAGRANAGPKGTREKSGTGKVERGKKKERKWEQVWSIVNFTKSLRCVNGINKWINLSVGLWSVTPYCRVPSGSLVSNLFLSLTHTHTYTLAFTKAHTHKSSELLSIVKWSLVEMFEYLQWFGKNLHTMNEHTHGKHKT